MSVRMKTITRPAVPETTVEVIDVVRCDLCSAQENDRDEQSPNWASGCSVQEVTIRYKRGSDWGGDGYSYRLISYHVCPKCFVTKLEPWLSSQGASPTESEDECL